MRLISKVASYATSIKPSSEAEERWSWLRCLLKRVKMAAAYERNKQRVKKKSRQWTNTELKYFASVLADEENDFALQLDTLALKKSANEAVCRDIKADFEARLSEQDFKEENDKEIENNPKRFELPLELTTEKLRVKFKWMKDQWKKITDRVRVGSGKAPVQEPAWYKKLNPIFSLEVVVCTPFLLIILPANGSAYSLTVRFRALTDSSQPFSAF